LQTDSTALSYTSNPIIGVLPVLSLADNGCQDRRVVAGPCFDVHPFGMGARTAATRFGGRDVRRADATLRIVKDVHDDV